MPLNCHVSSSSLVPIYRQIVDQVRQAVVRGALVPGEALPSVRAMAEELLINPNTVARAYQELIRDGIAESQAGKAVVIAERRRVYVAAERQRRIRPMVEALVREAEVLGFSAEEVQGLVARAMKKQMQE